MTIIEGALIDVGSQACKEDTDYDMTCETSTTDARCFRLNFLTEMTQEKLVTKIFATIRILGCLHCLCTPKNKYSLAAQNVFVSRQT